MLVRRTVRGAAVTPARPRLAATHLPPLAVAEVCRRVPVLTPQDRRTTAATRMRELGTDAAVVVDGDRLVGLVTATDIVRSLARPE
jgi:CBS domain-containing protein